MGKERERKDWNCHMGKERLAKCHMGKEREMKEVGIATWEKGKTWELPHG